jgi:hypothetical protein
MSCHQTAGQNHNVKIVIESLKNVAQFKYFGTKVTNKNSIRKELRQDWIRVMLATIQSTTSSLLIHCLKT